MQMFWLNSYKLGKILIKSHCYVYIQLIHGVVWQKKTQHYKAIILQLKINEEKQKK